MQPADASWCEVIEKFDRSVHVAECATFTRIRDGGDNVRAGGRIVDRDLLVAYWVVVWVAGSSHYGD